MVIGKWYFILPSAVVSTDRKRTAMRRFKERLPDLSQKEAEAVKNYHRKYVKTIPGKPHYKRPVLTFFFNNSGLLYHHLALTIRRVISIRILMLWASPI